jgi:hypothetical protein
MNVYEKLVDARIRFQSSNPKMSGENTFAKYKYFELQDILPAINLLSKELKFICRVTFREDLARLDFIDTEKPDDFISFDSPFSTASLKGCHEVQNLGAVETYLKRYLYQNCFEIVESDILNGTQGSDKKQEPEAVKTNTAELGKAVSDLIDWIQTEPPVFNDTQKAWAEKQIADKNLAGIKTAIAKASELAKVVK